MADAARTATSERYQSATANVRAAFDTIADKDGGTTGWQQWFPVLWAWNRAGGALGARQKLTTPKNDLRHLEEAWSHADDTDHPAATRAALAKGAEDLYDRMRHTFPELGGPVDEHYDLAPAKRKPGATGPLSVGTVDVTTAKPVRDESVTFQEENEFLARERVDEAQRFAAEQRKRLDDEWRKLLHAIKIGAVAVGAVVVVGGVTYVVVREAASE